MNDRCLEPPISQLSSANAALLSHTHTSSFRPHVGVLTVDFLSFSISLPPALPPTSTKYIHTHTLKVIDVFFSPISELSQSPQNNHIGYVCCVVQVESTSRPDLVLFLIKYLMMLIVGIPSVFWVGSKKTCFEWASFFHGKRRKEYV